MDRWNEYKLIAARVPDRAVLIGALALTACVGLWDYAAERDRRYDAVVSELPSLATKVQAAFAEHEAAVRFVASSLDSSGSAPASPVTLHPERSGAPGLVSLYVVPAREREVGAAPEAAATGWATCAGQVADEDTRRAVGQALPTGAPPPGHVAFALLTTASARSAERGVLYLPVYAYDRTSGTGALRGYMVAVLNLRDILLALPSTRGRDVGVQFAPLATYHASGVAETSTGQGTTLDCSWASAPVASATLVAGDQAWSLRWVASARRGSWESFPWISAPLGIAIGAILFVLKRRFGPYDRALHRQAWSAPPPAVPPLANAREWALAGRALHYRSHSPDEGWPT